MNVNLKLLHTFLLVADNCSFRRAAEQSNRSQSAVSMQIRQLELQLGVSLFHRTTRRVQLTREGELLLEYARKAVRELQVGLRQIKEAVGIERGQLSFACAPTVAASRIPRILAAFQKRYPSITAHVVEQVSADMLESIRRQDVDFGIGARVSNAVEFHFHPILVDEICALIPSSMELSHRDSVSLAELSTVPTLLVTGPSALNKTLEEAQQHSGISLQIKYEVRQVQTQVAMAAAGLGVAILPRIAVPTVPDPSLKAVPIVDPPLSRELCVVTLRGHALPPAAARFVPLLQQMIGEPDPPAAQVTPIRPSADGGRAGLSVVGGRG